jgi:hypothetical protein
MPQTAIFWIFLIRIYCFFNGNRFNLRKMIEVPPLQDKRRIGKFFSMCSMAPTIILPATLPAPLVGSEQRFG